MFAARSWMVAFLTFAMAAGVSESGGLAPTTVVAVAGIGGTAASILGGELAVRFGRRRVVTAIMWTSALIALLIGFSAHLSYRAAVLLCIVYTLFFQGDSAAIHAGVITAAEPRRRGATMALQSLAGFAAASAGSVFAGAVLDATGGGATTGSWALTFAAMGVVGALGPVCLRRYLAARPQLRF
jgi:MFS family permease